MRAENWKAANGSSKVRGRFDLMLDSGMIIRGCTLVDGKNGDFVSLPQRTYESGGSTKYAAIIEFVSRERGEKFFDAALTAIKALRQAKQGEAA